MDGRRMMSCDGNKGMAAAPTGERADKRGAGRRQQKAEERYSIKKDDESFLFFLTI
jgi:hypothetical protein